MKTLAVQIPVWLHDRIGSGCKSLNIDRRDFVVAALEQAIDEAGWAPADPE
jgi:hypothetical protein